MNKVFSIIARRIVFQNIRLLYCGYYQAKFYSHINYDAPINACCITSDSNLILIKRFKHKKKDSVKKMQEDFESDEEDEEDEEFEKDESRSKAILITARLSSLRIDLVAKVGLGIARKKIEEAFFESKIRVNGKKVLKLSTQVNTNDEIDLIRGRSNENPNLLIISRVTVLSIEPVSGYIRVKLSKEKTLLIEEYTESWTN